MEWAVAGSRVALAEIEATGKLQVTNQAQAVIRAREAGIGADQAAMC